MSPAILAFFVAGGVVGGIFGYLSQVAYSTRLLRDLDFYERERWRHFHSS